MDLFSVWILYRLPYFAAPFFVWMLGRRIWVWLRFYNPPLTLLPGARGSVYRIWRRQYRPRIQLFPGPRRTGTEIWRSLKGFVFFAGLWKRDKVLWVGSWTLHVGLVLFVLGYLRLALFPHPGRAFAGWILWGSGLMAFSGVYLLVRRLLVKRVREITEARDFLAEGVLLAVSASAWILGFTEGTDALQVRAYLVGLASFDRVLGNPEPLLVWHLFFVQMLLLVMPFSHLLHCAGMFLTRQFLGSSDSFAVEFGQENGVSEEKV